LKRNIKDSELRNTIVIGREYMMQTWETKSDTCFDLVMNNVFKRLEWKLLRKEMDNNDGVELFKLHQLLWCVCYP